MAHTTAHESKSSNAEPWTPGHSATLSSPARGQALSRVHWPPKALPRWKLPVVIVPILAPGWAGTPHPRSTSTSPRGPGVGRFARRLPSPSPCDTPAASSSWPTPSLAWPSRRYVNTAGGAGLPQPPHAALRRGMQTGFDSPEQLHNSIHIAKGRGRKIKIS